jgi:Na+-translocating ferredoxin:NAD+ oxidoreductase subunit E
VTDERHISRSVLHDRALLVALCPLIAVSDTLVNALGSSVVALIASSLTAVIAVLIARWISDELRFASNFLIFAIIIGILELAVLALFPRLRVSLGVFLPLIACNLAVLWSIQEPTASWQQVINTLRLCGIITLALVLLGAARELVGHGSLMHDAGASLSPWFTRLEWTVFDLDMGFLLAMLPPGAFISLGLLIALANWFRSYRTIER